MAELTRRKFWLEAIREIQDDIELLNGLIELPELDAKMAAEATDEARKLERKIRELELKANGFAVESEMITLAADKNLKITEVPISNIYTKDGSTHHPIRHGIDVLSRIIVMISERRPLFIFGIAGGVLLVVGLVFGVRVIDIASTTGDLAIGSAVLTALFIITGILSIFTGVILNALARRK